MTPRYYPRAIVQASAVFTVGGLTGEGQVLDLTVPGCLIESPLSLKPGDSLTLRVNLPQMGATFRVALGVVRWVEGTRFGVEFVQMDQHDRLRYNALVGALLHQQTAAPPQSTRTRYSRPLDGVNWHLDTHGVPTPPRPGARAGTKPRTR